MLVLQSYEYTLKSYFLFGYNINVMNDKSGLRCIYLKYVAIELQSVYVL